MQPVQEFLYPKPEQDFIFSRQKHMRTMRKVWCRNHRQSTKTVQIYAEIETKFTSNHSDTQLVFEHERQIAKLILCKKLTVCTETVSSAITCFAQTNGVPYITLLIDLL